MFNPDTSRQKFIDRWNNPNENFEGETPYLSGAMKRYVIQDKISFHPLIIYPKIIDRHFVGEEMKEEVSFDVPMRVYYPDEFKKTIENHGFRIAGSWGGYNGQIYGEGTELVVKFELSNQG